MAHDVIEMRENEFKLRAFKKSHVVCSVDVCYLQRHAREYLYVLVIGDDSAVALVNAFIHG